MDPPSGYVALMQKCNEASAAPLTNPGAVVCRSNLASAQLARLHLGLCFHLPDWFCGLMREGSILGRGFDLRAIDGYEDEVKDVLLRTFEPERLVEEALEHRPGRELTRGHFLPIGGSGKRGRSLFLVSLDDRPRTGELYHWTPRSPTPRALGIGVQALQLIGEDAGGKLRRRLPSAQVQPVKTAATRRMSARGPRRSTPPTSAAARTLEMFA